MADPEITKRIFVKGFSRETTEGDLKTFFEEYGTVKESKIVKDKTGASKGYAFITFENQEAADNVREQEVVELNEKKLSIFKAMRRRSARQYGRDYYSRDFRHHNPRHFNDTIHPTTYSTMHDGSVYFGQFGSAVQQPQVVTLFPTAAYQQHQFHPNQTTFTQQSAPQPAIYMVGPSVASNPTHPYQVAAATSPYHSWNEWGMPVNVVPKTVHPTFTSFTDHHLSQAEIAMANLVVADVPTSIAENPNGATVEQNVTLFPRYALNNNLTDRPCTQYIPLEAKLKSDKPKTVTAVPVKFLKKVETTQTPGSAPTTIHVVTSNGQVVTPQ